MDSQADPRFNLYIHNFLLRPSYDIIFGMHSRPKIHNPIDLRNKRGKTTNITSRYYYQPFITTLCLYILKKDYKGIW